MSDQIIYLASPYTHADPTVRSMRFLAACRAAAEMMRDGMIVYSPIAHSHPIALWNDMPVEWKFWRRQCLAMLFQCDAMVILTLDGWEQSVGVAAEIKSATDWQIPITKREAVQS